MFNTLCPMFQIRPILLHPAKELVFGNYTGNVLVSTNESIELNLVGSALSCYKQKIVNQNMVHHNEFRNMPLRTYNLGHNAIQHVACNPIEVKTDQRHLIFVKKYLI